MAKFEELFVNWALGALIVFSILSFAIIVQEDNNANEKLIDNTLLNGSFTQLQSDLEGMRSQSQSQREAFEEEKPTAGFGSLVLFSVVSSGKVFTGITIGTFNVLIRLPMVLFGVDPIISSVLSTILIVMIILGLWLLYKLGG